MSGRRLGGQCSASLLLVLGISVAGWCQDGGPMTPPQGAPAASSAPAPVPASNSAAASAPASNSSKPAMVEVPGGTHIPLVIHNAISTRSARPGDPVYFETLFPVLIDGRIAIPAGTYVSGEVTESKRPGRVKGRGELMIKLT